MKTRGPEERGFTLIEALIAMTIFAIGSVMVVPTIYAWMHANIVTRQRDQAGRILDRTADTLAQQGWSSAEWSTVSATTSSYPYALGTALKNPTYNNWVSYSPSQVALTTSVNIGYAVATITNDLNQPVSKIMKVRVQWTGPENNTLEETRIIQRNQ
ncbi:MAG TPA: type II secretion system protein [Gammaproteobacteria bacterium]|nr:type II secretion system protein [Gammaproteobacteria bacterium]